MSAGSRASIIRQYTGTAPLEAFSSGRWNATDSHGPGNHKLNSALHHAGMSHRRTDPQGIAYYGSKLDDGKGKKGALKCRKRRFPTPSTVPS